MKTIWLCYKTDRWGVDVSHMKATFSMGKALEWEASGQYHFIEELEIEE